MICLRCGHCCKHMAVVVVKNPDEPPEENNLLARTGKEPCPHLEQEAEGRYRCKVHDKPWYEQTPCAQFTQVEKGNEPCRLGVYYLKEKNHAP